MEELVPTNTGEIATSVIPVMRYRDLPAAIDWLCKAFGFEKQHVTAGRNGGVLFAQLTLGTAMIMLGPVRMSAFDKLLKQPDEIGGAETQVCYFFVADARAHFARAKRAGAEIVFDVEDQANGGRSYSCRDPEGHLWNFGTYNPWQRQAVARLQHDQHRSKFGGAVKPAALAIAMSLVIAIAAAAKIPVAVQEALHELASKTVAANAPKEDRRLALEWQDRWKSGNATSLAAGDNPSTSVGNVAAVEYALNAARQHLTRAMSEKEEAERIAVVARRQLTQALGDKQAAEQNAKDMQDRLVRTWIGRNVAERAAKVARQQLARERSARKAAECARLALPLQQLPPAPLW